MSLDHVAADEQRQSLASFFRRLPRRGVQGDDHLEDAPRILEEEVFAEEQLAVSFRSRNRRGYEGEARETAAESSMETFIEKKGAIPKGNAPF